MGDTNPVTEFVSPTSKEVGHPPGPRTDPTPGYRIRERVECFDSLLELLVVGGGTGDEKSAVGFVAAEATEELVAPFDLEGQVAG